MGRTREENAQHQREVQQRRKERVTASKDLVDAFARASIEIREVHGKPYIELIAPQEVHDALEEYCQKHQTDVETYLSAVGQELLLKAARGGRDE